MGVTITRTADEPYHGFDQGADNHPVSLEPGESVEVSEAKAEQLAADFPADFAIAKPAAKRRAKAPKEAS